MGRYTKHFEQGAIISASTGNLKELGAANTENKTTGIKAKNAVPDTDLSKIFKTDPRTEDLTEDTKPWSILLDLAWKQDQELAKILHGFRCCGTRLKWADGAWVLRPDVDPTGDAAWESVERYNEAKEKWLRPQQKEIMELLRRLGRAIQPRLTKEGEKGNGQGQTA